MAKPPGTMRVTNATPRQYAGQVGIAQVLRREKWVLGLLAIVFLVKLAVVIQLNRHPLLHPEAGLDTTAYVHLAQQVTAGDWWLGPGLYHVAPFYIYFLAATLSVFESFTAVRVTQAAVGTLAVGGIFLMTRVWFGARAGWIAAILAGATGLLTFYESLILQSSLDAFFTAAALCALTYALRAPSSAPVPHVAGTTAHHLPHTSNGADRTARAGPRLSFVVSAFLLTGVIFGLSTLNRPNMLFAAGTVIIACLLLRGWRHGLLLTAGLVLGLSPSIVRNVVVAGEWALVSSHGGLNLYIGNNENATGFYREVPGIRPLIEGQQEDVRIVAAAALGRPVSDAEASDYFRERATTWMRDHPHAAVQLFARKIFYTFHAQHVALPHSYPFFAYEMDTALQWLIVGPWLLVPLGLTGLAAGGASLQTSGRSLRDYLVWAAFVPGYAAGVALFFVAERYRLPLFVPLCVGAGAAVDHACRAFASKRVNTLTGFAALLVALAIAVNWRLPLNDGRWDDGLRTAQRLVITGDYAAADAWVDRLERTTSQPGRAHHGVGMQLVARDEPQRALAHLTRSLELGYSQKDDAEIWLRLGRLSARTQDPAAADRFFRRAVALAPHQASARQQHGLNLLLMERIPEARHELSEAVRLAPDDPDSLAHLAYCEVKLGDLEPARLHVREALKHAPGHHLARQLAAALGLG